MSTRTILKPHVVLDAGDMSGDLTSDVTILQSLNIVCYQCIWSGTAPVGTLAIQGSNDYSILADGTVDKAGTWTTITVVDPSTGSPVNSLPVSGNTGSVAFDPIRTSFYATRIQYTFGSGVGSLTIVVTAKVA